MILEAHYGVFADSQWSEANIPDLGATDGDQTEQSHLRVQVTTCPTL